MHRLAVGQAAEDQDLASKYPARAFDLDTCQAPEAHTVEENRLLRQPLQPPALLGDQ